MNKKHFTQFAVMGLFFALLAVVLLRSIRWISGSKLAAGRPTSVAVGQSSPRDDSRRDAIQSGATVGARETVKQSLSSAPPAVQAMEMAAEQTPVEMKTDALQMPLAVVPTDPAERLDVQRVRLLSHLGGRFIEATDAAPAPRVSPNKAWQSAQEVSDEEFRLFLGTEAFLQQQIRRARQEYDKTSAL